MGDGAPSRKQTIDPRKRRKEPRNDSEPSPTQMLFILKEKLKELRCAHLLVPSVSIHMTSTYPPYPQKAESRGGERGWRPLTLADRGRTTEQRRETTEEKTQLLDSQKAKSKPREAGAERGGY